MKKSGFNTNAIKTTTTITATAAATKTAIAVTNTAANSVAATATVITDETTLNELIHIARNNAVAKPKVTPKITQLRKNANCVISIERQDVRFSLSVYDNGYAAYETDGRSTVIDLDKIFAVEFSSNIYSCELTAEDIENLPWHVALTELGEEQILQNLSRNRAFEAGSDDDEDERNKIKPVLNVHIDAPDVAYERRETQKEIRRALAKTRATMTEKQAEAFILYYDQEMGEEEIGRILKVSQQAVSQRLEVVKRNLRQNMEQFL